MTIMKDLQENNIIEKAGYEHQTVGRQAALYTLGSKNYFAIGLDVDVRPIYLAISKLDGTPICTKVWEVSPESSAKDILDSIIIYIKNVLKEAKISSDKIVGLGLGLPAVVDINRNSAEKISRIRDWNNIDVADVLEKEFSFPVYIRNDSHLLSNLEISPENQEFIYFLHRSGIGMAAVINGEVYEGHFGNAGYIGHTKVASNGEKCDCGAEDCLELFCSKRRIEKNYQKAVGEKYTYDQIVKFANEGDEEAVKIFENAGHYFGIGIANAVKTFDIPSIIIGDLRCTEEHVFFKSIVKSVEENLNNFRISDIDIKLASYPSEMNGLGGCQYVLNRFFVEPKLQTNLSNLEGSNKDGQTI